MEFTSLFGLALCVLAAAAIVVVGYLLVWRRSSGVGSNQASGTLADKLSRGPLSLSEAIRIFTPIAGTLDGLHGQGILHRHLKPGSILFDEHDNPSLGEAGSTTPGAPEYMSPEEVRGQPLDGRADIYSLGAVMYHALTGHPPFEGATEQGIMFKQATEPARPPRELRPDLPESVDAVLLKALAKRPEERYQTAAEFARALAAAAEGKAARGTVQPQAPGAAAPTAEPVSLVTPLPAGQVALPKKRGIGTWFVIGGVGVLALCLCVWFAAALYQRTWLAYKYAPAYPTTTRFAVPPKPTPEPQAAIWFWSADYSPDGKRIVTTHDDNTVRVWDAATGKRLGIQPAKGNVYDAVYSPDGTRILTTDGGAMSEGYSAGVWDDTLGKQLTRLTGHTSLLFDARYNPQGTQIVTASEDGTTRVWDAATGKQELLLGDHDYWILKAIYSPDGKQVAAAAESHHLEIWDAATGKSLATFSAWSVDYSPDSKHVAMVMDDNTAWVMDTATWTKLLVLEHTGGVGGVTYSPDGKQIVTRGKDMTARIWDAETGKQVAVLGGHTRSLSTAIYSPDGRYIVTATHSDPTWVWNAQTGDLVATLGPKGDGVDVAVFSRDGKQLFTGNESGTAHVWDTEALNELVAWNTKATTAATLPPPIATATAQARLPTTQVAPQTATAAAIAPLATLKASEGWKVLLTDKFDDNQNGWTTGDGKSIADGKYVWDMNNRVNIYRGLPQMAPPSDLAANIDARLVSGSPDCRFGLTFRNSTDPGYMTDYVFYIHNDQRWGFDIIHSPDPGIAQYGTSDAIVPRALNRITVTAQGRHFTFFVNGKYVGQAEDGTLARGKIGAAVWILGPGACQIEFDNFEVSAP